VALAEGRDPEQVAESVVGHGALALLDAVNNYVES
jgi:hypothetical protein